MKLVISIILISMLLFPRFALAQQGPGEPDSKFEYMNEDGEEVFGPNYLPELPDDLGPAYWIGQPNAGVIVPENYLMIPQDAFGLGEDFKSLPNEQPGFRLFPSVPLMRDFEGKELIPEKYQSPDLQKSPGFRRERKARDAKPSTMYAHFIDVGQGDATILEFPCGVAVIDVGGEYSGKLFSRYLKKFFATRPHLNKTIDLVVLTHPHADHINGVDHLFDANGNSPYKIRNVVDNGHGHKSKDSLFKQKKFRDRAKKKGAEYSAVQIRRQRTATGVTNTVIDPIRCPDIDPILTAFWGGVTNVDLLNGPYKNPNNHSVVLRVDFGRASFLFSGDLEKVAERHMRNSYGANSRVFDVDVYQVSHHGARVDTSDDLMKLMTPKIAVISMGKPKKPNKAWSYGHPNTRLIKVLHDAPEIVTGFRKKTRKFLASPKAKSKYEEVIIKRAIYGTGWEDTVIIQASSDGKYEIKSRVAK